MAEQKISTPLKRAQSNAHVATVDDIAYEAHDIVTSAGSYYGIKVSLKQKLDELSQYIEQGGNLGDVSDQISALTNQLNELKDKHDQDMTSAEGYATQAKIASENAAIIRDSMTSTLTQTKAELTTLSNDTQSYVSEVQNDVKIIKDVADTLALSFDSQAQFQVISEQNYQTLTKDENTIYFIYDVQS